MAARSSEPYGGFILHYNGSTWSDIGRGTEGELEAVWGCSAANGYATDAPSGLYHYDGSTWTKSGTIDDAAGIWGSCSSDVFLVGDFSYVSHYDGMAWTSTYTGANLPLLDV